MKADWEDTYEMRDEYDFSNAVRNPYFQEFRELNLVSLDPDVKAVFVDSEAVNTALRSMIAERYSSSGLELKKAS
jgi:hypothetical protein